MLKVNLSCGKSLQFDLADESQAKEWAKQAADSSFQQKITALTVIVNGVQYALPRPQGLLPVFMFAENMAREASTGSKGGERIVVHAGDIGIVVTAHAGQRAARVNIVREGKLRFNPLLR